MRVVLACGSREWKNLGKIWETLEKMHKQDPITFLVQGGNGEVDPRGKPTKGADLMAEHVAKQLGIQTVRCDALWNSYGNKAGPIRNSMQLKLAIALAVYPAAPLPEEGGWESNITVVAFHPNLSDSRGTADIVKKAKKAGCRVVVVG